LCRRELAGGEVGDNLACAYEIIEDAFLKS